MLIIPAIDLQAGRCVRLTQGRLGTTTVYSENPVEVAREWVRQGAKRLHVVDLDGAFGGNPENGPIIEKITAAVEVPVQVGGGIRSLETVEKYIKSGIDKVILGSKVVQDPHFLKETTTAFPGKVIVSIDAKGGLVMTEGWTEESGRSAIEVGRKASLQGAAMLIYTDIERDGMLSGPNLEAISKMVESMDIPVIASGGVGGLADIRSLRSIGPKKVAGVIIGKALYAGAVHLPDALIEARK
jgi:phosphoribosylformimino-5-aminoimidazole carboxamide ribotide isomerase